MRKAYGGLPVAQLAKSFLQPKYAGEMARKFTTRIRERVIAPAFEDPMPWLRKTQIDLSAYCKAIDPTLWEEAVRESDEIQACAARKLKTIDIDLGGGGNFPLLFFLVRQMQPTNIVETGVAAGFTSQAMLSALRKNGKGKLYSSDFPYFRIKDPEKYIGFVVDPDLKSDWKCLTRGDKSNLPAILSEIDNIDLFHYDSDKSYHGREWAMDLVLPRMRKGGAVVMDDLNDNCYFEHYVKHNNIDANIFEFNGKYVGLFFVK